MFVVSFFLYISAFLISCIAAWRYSLIDDRIGYKKRSLKVIFRRGDDIKFFYMFFIILPPVLIATFRGLNIGTDTNVYLEIYHDNKLYNLIEYLKIYGKNGHEYEIGYQQILHISYILRGGFNLVKFLSEFFIIFFAWRGTVYFHRKFRVNSGLCLYFVYLLEYSYGLNGTRYAIGLSIFFFGFQFLIEKKFIKYAITCFFCVMFHTTLVLTILFYLINLLDNDFFRKHGKIFICIIIIALVLFLKTLINFFLPLILLYTVRYNNYMVDTTISFGYGIYLIFALFLFPLIRWDSFIKNNNNWLIIIIAMLVFIPFRFLGYINQWFGRLSRMPEILFSVLYSGIIKLHIRHNEKILWLLYTIFLVLAHYILTVIIQGSGELYPYVLDFTNYI